MTFEGNNRVKETMTNILLRRYESFKMKFVEIVTEMFNSFVDIINGLAYQGKPISFEKKVNKLLDFPMEQH